MKKKIKRGTKPSARPSTKASKAPAKPSTSPPALPKRSPAAERFDGAHFVLCELVAELDRDRPDEFRLEQLRGIFDHARPAMAAPPSEDDPEELAEAAELVIEIGRRLNRLQGRGNAAANDVHRAASPASRASTTPPTLRDLTEELRDLTRRFDALAAELAPAEKLTAGPTGAKRSQGAA